MGPCPMGLVAGEPEAPPDHSPAGKCLPHPAPPVAAPSPAPSPPPPARHGAGHRSVGLRIPWCGGQVQNRPMGPGINGHMGPWPSGQWAADPSRRTMARAPCAVTGAWLPCPRAHRPMVPWPTGRHVGTGHRCMGRFVPQCSARAHSRPMGPVACGPTGHWPAG